ncbi:hypothetical protein RFI_00445 [Reticulomyxa filosa]|uniref:Uncharacterized protein n=1 Tax=Reticulomyxa filosa TaxID=46433 RepID=X6PFZ2_RETFI|nr:hypothetical protein RFI_00445 [Reticulomyxa filosa]|eukprot:ETO36617.1 hypothetical protein RFI_00445 [Reticulomyxa filosa]
MRLVKKPMLEKDLQKSLVSKFAKFIYIEVSFIQNFPRKKHSAKHALDFNLFVSLNAKKRKKEEIEFSTTLNKTKEMLLHLRKFFSTTCSKRTAFSLDPNFVKYYCSRKSGGKQWSASSTGHFGCFRATLSPTTWYQKKKRKNTINCDNLIIFFSKKEIFFIRTISVRQSVGPKKKTKNKKTELRRRCNTKGSTSDVRQDIHDEVLARRTRTMGNGSANNRRKEAICGGE